MAPSYVLHQYPYRDTSRIVEAFTAEHGRISLFARGAGGPKSTLKGVLRPFQRLLLSWTGKSEAGALTGAEIDGTATAIPKERLMSGFYLNELLLKLTERWDPHPEIFLSYDVCIAALSAGEGEELSARRVVWLMHRHFLFSPCSRKLARYATISSICSAERIGLPRQAGPTRLRPSTR